jgi:hypothetical protein
MRMVPDELLRQFDASRSSAGVGKRGWATSGSARQKARNSMERQTLDMGFLSFFSGRDGFRQSVLRCAEALPLCINASYA